jgi:predicted transcriptional regulator
MVNGRVMLMSIRPEYADRIFSGHKRFELRRQRPRLDEGDLVVVYATSPSQAVRGAFGVKRVVSLSVRALWNQFEPELGISRHSYDSYFSGCAMAHAIEVGEVRTWPAASLPSLRERFEGFRPPQSYMFWPARWSMPCDWWSNERLPRAATGNRVVASPRRTIEDHCGRLQP